MKWYWKKNKFVNFCLLFILNFLYVKEGNRNYKCCKTFYVVYVFYSYDAIPLRPWIVLLFLLAEAECVTLQVQYFRKTTTTKLFFF